MQYLAPHSTLCNIVPCAAKYYVPQNSPFLQYIYMWLNDWMTERLNDFWIERLNDFATERLRGKIRLNDFGNANTKIKKSTWTIDGFQKKTTKTTFFLAQSEQRIYILLIFAPTTTNNNKQLWKILILFTGTWNPQRLVTLWLLAVLALSMGLEIWSFAAKFLRFAKFL